MTAITRAGATKAPVTARNARRDKTAAAEALSSHALGVFREAVEELEIANELLVEAVVEDNETVAEITNRINVSNAAIDANSKAISKIRDLVS